MADSMESRPQVIIVEDEPVLRDNLTIGLTSHGFDVRGVADGVHLDTAMAVHPVDVVVLDLGLAGEDDVAIAKRLKRRPELGLIMVIARSSADDRVLGLESGSGCDAPIILTLSISRLKMDT